MPSRNSEVDIEKIVEEVVNRIGAEVVRHLTRRMVPRAEVVGKIGKEKDLRRCEEAGWITRASGQGPRAKALYRSRDVEALLDRYDQGLRPPPLRCEVEYERPAPRRRRRRADENVAQQEAA
ncbi:hypothetical protein [Verrucomicrobium sp. GAS474]|uniref:hypothetical protein n=1 Tax=Verrucomicrobium sp. GAS474 TaxID=1882831 RepID=UPI0012FFA66D|nr:hypothetical protein [Verrucomicrobium sp. GAS474]